jgi:drug/metabolite transporter (DMT)-like permease
MPKTPSTSATTASLDLRGVLLIILVCVLWGGSIPTIAMSEHGMPPLFAATGRVVVATLLLWLYGRLSRQPVVVPREHRLHGVILGVLFSLTMIALYQGLVFTDAARGTIFYSVKPFWVALGAHVLISDERLNGVKVMGLLVALFGIYLTFWAPGATGLQADIGNLMEIAAALFFSATVLYTKWLSRRGEVNHLQTLFSMMLFSIPVLGVAALFLEWGYPVSFASEDLLAFVYQSLGAQFLAYVIWFWLIHRYAVSQVASFTFLVPLVGVSLGHTLLGNTTPPSLWLGLALVMAGIVLINWPRQTRKSPVT